MATNKILLQLYTYKDISELSYAQKITQYCKDIGICWERIDFKEPIRQEYSDELFYKLWSTARHGGFNKEAEVQYSCVFCLQKSPRLLLSANWRKSFQPRYSDFSLEVPYKLFIQKRKEFECLFYLLIELFNADYACIANGSFWFKCHEDYSKKIPVYKDIHWITFISDERIHEMKTSFDNLSWHKHMDIQNGSVFYICDDVPKDGDQTEKTCLEYRSLLWDI